MTSINSFFQTLVIKTSKIKTEYWWMLLLVLGWLMIVGAFGWFISSSQAMASSSVSNFNTNSANQDTGLDTESSALETNSNNNPSELNSNIPIPINTKSKESSLVVSVSGAVQHPGVFYLPEASLLAKAIQEAGGFSRLASQKFIHQELNLAQELQDHQHIWIPFESDTVQDGTPTKSGQESTTNETDLISINSATALELEELKGIGPSKANKIIEARPFGTIEELVSKGAISEVLFDSIKSEIRL